MKKLFIVASIIGLMTTSQVFADEAVQPADRPQAPCPMTQCGRPDGFHKMKKHPDFKKFEETLKLTDEQKAKAKEIRDNEFQQIKPIFDKIAEKNREQQAIMEQRLTAKERMEALAPIRKEIHELRGEIHKIKKQGRESFKAILTDKQVKQLEKMKADARKDFEKKFGKQHRHGDRMHRPMPPRCHCPEPQFGVPAEPPIEPPVPPVEK